MNINEAVKNYEQSLKIIDEYFDGCVVGSVELMLDFYWSYDNSISYQEKPFDPYEDEADYSFEIYGTSFWQKEKYTLANVDDGCGNRFCILLDNSKRVDNEIAKQRT